MVGQGVLRECLMDPDVAAETLSGRTENALLRLPFKAAYMFRPGAIQPLHGVRSKTAIYRVLYSVTAVLLALLRRALPGYILTTEQLGRAMIAVDRHGAPKRILDSRDISARVRVTSSSVI